MPKVSIIMDGTEQSFNIGSEETIYNGVSGHGLDLPHGCLAGSCGACRVKVLKGDESFSPMKTVENETVSSITKELQEKQDKPFPHKIRLSCRSKIHGDVTISPF